LNDTPDIDLGSLPDKRTFEPKVYPKQGHICPKCDKPAMKGLYPAPNLLVDTEIVTDGEEGKEMCGRCIGLRSIAAGVQIGRMYDSHQDIDDELRFRENDGDEETEEEYQGIDPTVEPPEGTEPRFEGSSGG